MLIEFTCVDGTKTVIESSNVDAVYPADEVNNRTRIVTSSDYHNVQDRYEDVVYRVKGANRRRFLALTSAHNGTLIYTFADQIETVCNSLTIKDATQIVTKSGDMFAVTESPEEVMTDILSEPFSKA